jgi:hypothetical protein
MKRRSNLLPAGFKEDLFRRNRFYVARQTNEDLPYILKYGMEDNLMIGTDYSHADQSAKIAALDVIEQRAAKGEISPTVAARSWTTIRDGSTDYNSPLTASWSACTERMARWMLQ